MFRGGRFSEPGTLSSVIKPEMVQNNYSLEVAKLGEFSRVDSFFYTKADIQLTLTPSRIQKSQPHDDKKAKWICLIISCISWCFGWVALLSTWYWFLQALGAYVSYFRALFETMKQLSGSELTCLWADFKSEASEIGLSWRLLRDSEIQNDSRL